MRNLGLALVFMMMVAAPHAVHAKKRSGGKHAKARHTKSLKHKKPVRHARATPPRRLEADDDLATAVAAKKSAPRTVMTSSIAPSAVAPISNEPVSMTNQELDDEVPGAKHKR
jgi:hypothetical protein